MYKPSKYKPPKIVTQKTPGKWPLQIQAPRVACTWNLPSKYKVKQSKKGKFPSHYKLAQSILKRKFSPVDKPLQK